MTSFCTDVEFVELDVTGLRDAAARLAEAMRRGLATGPGAEAVLRAAECLEEKPRMRWRPVRIPLRIRTTLRIDGCEGVEFEAECSCYECDIIALVVRDNVTGVTARLDETGRLRVTVGGVVVLELHVDEALCVARSNGNDCDRGDRFEEKRRRNVLERMLAQPEPATRRVCAVKADARRIRETVARLADELKGRTSGFVVDALDAALKCVGDYVTGFSEGGYVADGFIVENVKVDGCDADIVAVTRCRGNDCEVVALEVRDGSGVLVLTVSAEGRLTLYRRIRAGEGGLDRVFSYTLGGR